VSPAAYNLAPTRHDALRCAAIPARTIKERAMTNDDADRDRARRAKLMAARTEAIARRDWAAMSEITKRIAKIDPPGWKCEDMKGTN
jgi:hypothetical protein